MVVKNSERQRLTYSDDSYIMITSHLPYTRNGLKFFTKRGGLTFSEVEKILCDLAALKYANRQSKVALTLSTLDKLFKRESITMILLSKELRQESSFIRSPCFNVSIHIITFFFFCWCMLLDSSECW